MADKIGSFVLTYCLFTVALAIATLIGAVLLRASCTLYNLLAGASDEPSGRPAHDSAEGGLQTETSSDPAPALAAHVARQDQEGSAIARTPLGERSLAVDDDWEDQVNVATLPGVPKPSLEWAMGIYFITALVSTMASFILYRFLRLAGLAVGAGTLRYLPILIVSLPLRTLILGCMNAVMLPTRLGKGMMVALNFFLLESILIAILAVIFYLIALVFGLSLFRFG